MKIWTVNYIHSPWVGHGFEVLAVFSTEALAIAYRDQCIAYSNGQIGGRDYREGYEVEDWDVDDPCIVKANRPSDAVVMR